jgi:hypothetical protein
LHLTLFLYTPTFYFLSKIQLSRNLIWKPCSITNIKLINRIGYAPFPFFVSKFKIFSWL